MLLRQKQSFDMTTIQNDYVLGCVNETEMTMKSLNNIDYPPELVDMLIPIFELVWKIVLERLMPHFSKK